MKQSLYLYGILLTLGSQAHAFDSTPQESDNTSILWHVGVKGGLGFNISSAMDSEVNRTKSTTNSSSYLAGLIVGVSHTHLAYAQIEVLYMQHQFIRYAYQAKANYVSIPVLLHLQFGLGTFLNIGIAPTYLTHGEVTEDKQTTNDMDIYFKRLGANLEVGVGWEFSPINYSSFFFELRLSYSLFKINAQPARPLRYFTLMFNIGFQY